MSRILLIDDEPATRLVMQNRLRDLGHEVTSAENGAKGLLESRELPFDLILVDAGLDTGVGSHEVCRRLKQTPQTAGIPVLLVSKQGSGKEEIHRGYEAGCDVYLTKSDLVVLDDVVRSMLRFKGQVDDLARQNRALEEQARRMQQEQQQTAEVDVALQGTNGNGGPSGLPGGHPDGVLLVDADGIVRHADRGARELLGGGLEGKNLGMLAPATRLEAFVRDAHTEPRDGFRFDLGPRTGRPARTLIAAVVPLMSSPGDREAGTRVVVFYDTAKRRLLAELLRIQEHAVPQRELGGLREAARVAFGPPTLVGSSAEMIEVRAAVTAAALSRDPVLLTGELGAGKEHAARAIHFGGDTNGPFLELSCGELSPENLRSELFGQVRGSTPDALTDRPGLFQQAQQGTVYLADVDQLSAELQKELLAVIDTGSVSRSGTDRAEPVEARLLVSTSIDLEQAVAEGNFLRKLMQALGRVRIRMPSLRERSADVPELLQVFLARYGSDRPRLEVSDQALHVLQSYDWPGNVREIQGAIERACAHAPGDVIELEHLPAPLRELEPLADHEMVPSPPNRISVGGAPPPNRVVQALQGSVHEGGAAYEPWEIQPDDEVSLPLYEKKALLRALNETGGDKLAAARLLKVGKSTLYRKLKRYGIH